ncbi:MAG TPA: transporter substrate-binding domain-containing protein [Opitutaceae bacterium]|nr:transporter substrate-binding domain-containing protein [Opitutaceae bacterium]
MNSMFEISLIRRLAALLTLFTFAHGIRAQSVEEGKSETLDHIMKRGKILIGTEAVFPTFNVKNPTTGNYEGFMVDLSKALAKRLFGDENKLEFIYTKDEIRLQYVIKGEVDMLIDTTTSSAEKGKLVDFSDEIFRSGSGLMVKKGSSIKSIDDIKKGTRVIYVGENPDIKHIKARVPEATYLEFKKSPEAFAALKAGEGDVFTQVVTHLYRAASQDSNYVLVNRFTDKSYCIVIKKGDTAMRDYLNGFIKSLRESGDYDKIYQKWFGPYGGESVK